MSCQLSTTTLSPFVLGASLVAALTVHHGCGTPEPAHSVDGGAPRVGAADGGPEMDGGSFVPDAGVVDAGSNCRASVPCVDDSDCASTPGSRCNQAQSPPACQTLYCGSEGSACSDEAFCELGTSCRLGVCQPCTDCGSGCYDLARDPGNCGSCGVSCDAIEFPLELSQSLGAFLKGHGGCHDGACVADVEFVARTPAFSCDDACGWLPLGGGSTASCFAPRGAEYALINQGAIVHSEDQPLSDCGQVSLLEREGLMLRRVTCGCWLR